MKTKGKKAKKMPGVTNKKKNILSSLKIARWDEKGERELRGAIHFFCLSLQIWSAIHRLVILICCAK